MNFNIPQKKDDDNFLTATLFEGYDSDYHPKEYDWGKPKGREVW
jgi:hypothetical protein